MYLIAELCGYFSAMGLYYVAEKRLWLKPGSTHLFGRTRLHSDIGSPDERSYVIENKSVSRKHLVIRVAPVTDGEGVDANSRSKLTLTDDSRVGTYLDGEKFLKENRVLTENEHEIKLASYEQIFRIRWQPVILTFTLPEKRQARGNILQRPQTKLEPFDIKTVFPYIPNRTTHVVAGKRNTAKGLQALVNGRYIVTDELVNAIVKVASAPPNVEDPDVPLPSPLEEDFDENWPDALKFLPAEGKEPIPRPQKLFAPDPNRATVFTGYAFLFLDQNQFENLRDPIINGNGRPFLFEVQREITTPSEVVQYVKALAGEKGDGPYRGEDDNNAIIVIRFSGKKRTEEWDLRLMHNIDLALSQRSIEQNEFLDAIVMNDASGLKKKFEIDPTSLPLSANSRERKESITDAAANENRYNDITEDTINKNTSTNSSLVKRRFHRAVTESRFKGFDDFDESHFPTAKVVGEQTFNNQEKSTYPNDSVTVQSQNLFVEKSSPMRNLRKRRSPPSEDSLDAEGVVERLLPAAAAMKKRRLEGGTLAPPPNNKRNSTEHASEPIQAKQRQKKGAKKTEEEDILSTVRERREAEEAAARQDAESLERALDGMDIETIKSLVKVEEMEVRPRKNRSPVQKIEMQNRWDEKWNGRKNYKKFRRRGQVEPMRGQRVIVRIEEVKKKDFGISEEYWLESTTTQQQTTQSRSTQRDNRSSLQDDSRRSEDDESWSRNPRHPQEVTGDGNIILIQATHTENNERATQSSRQTRGMTAASAASASAGPAESRSGPRSRTGLGRGASTSAGTSMVVDSQAAQSAPGKRSAPDTSGGSEVPAVKKPRIPISRSRDDDDDGSDDGLRFRFRRRRQ